MYRKIISFTGLMVLAMVAGAQAGTIQGTVACGSHCGNLVVYLESVPGTYSGAGQVVEFDQKEKVFIPHVLPILKGTTVRMKNSDPFLHNIHAYLGKTTVFNIALPIPGQTMEVNKFDQPGVYLILCDVHPEMSAYIVVLDNPYFTQPNASGQFQIENVPPGTYTLVILDPERDKTWKKQVTVTNDQVVRLSF